MSKKMTNVQKRYVDQVERIQERHSLGQTGEQTHIASPLVMVTLPHSDPKCLTWERSSNNLRLILGCRTIQDPNTGESRLSGLPYGVYPRLILYYLCHQVKIVARPEIDLHRSLAAFMTERLGIKGVTGGRNGSVTHFKEQLTRLMNAIITLEALDTHEGWLGMTSQDILIADKRFLWWDANLNRATTLPKVVKLSNDFFQMVMHHSIPLDIEAIKAVRNSSLAAEKTTALV